MKCRVNTTIYVRLINYCFPIQSKPLPLNRCVFACVWHMSDCFVASPLHLVRCVSNTLQAQTSFVLLISFYSLRSAHLIKLNRLFDYWVEWFNFFIPFRKETHTLPFYGKVLHFSMRLSVSHSLLMRTGWFGCRPFPCCLIQTQALPLAYRLRMATL